MVSLRSLAQTWAGFMRQSGGGSPENGGENGVGSIHTMPTEIRVPTMAGVNPTTAETVSPAASNEDTLPSAAYTDPTMPSPNRHDGIAHPHHQQQQQQPTMAADAPGVRYDRGNRGNNTPSTVTASSQPADLANTVHALQLQLLAIQRAIQTARSDRLSHRP